MIWQEIIWATQLMKIPFKSLTSRELVSDYFSRLVLEVFLLCALLCLQIVLSGLLRHETVIIPHKFRPTELLDFAIK